VCATGRLSDHPTARPRPVTRAASRRAAVTRAARDLEQLALILAAVHKPAERAACIRIAADLRALR